MKPSSKLLRPAMAQPAVKAKPKAPSPVATERDQLVARKRIVELDVGKLIAASAGGIAKRLDDLTTSLRRDTSGRPKAIAGAVAIRVVGAARSDKTPVPLPNLRVALAAADGGSATALTDVTGLAVLRPEHAEGGDQPPPAKETPKPKANQTGAKEPAAAADKATYRLHVTASDGSTVANVEGDLSGTHLLQLGTSKSLEGHLVLGRGWLDAIDKAVARRTAAAKTAEARLADHLGRARERLAGIERRLDLHHKKA